MKTEKLWDPFCYLVFDSTPCAGLGQTPAKYQAKTMAFFYSRGLCWSRLYHSSPPESLKLCFFSTLCFVSYSCRRKAGQDRRKPGVSRWRTQWYHCSVGPTRPACPARLPLAIALARRAAQPPWDGHAPPALLYTTQHNLYRRKLFQNENLVGVRVKFVG